jgi:hypothetical protein
VKWWTDMDPISQAILISVALWLLILGALWLAASWLFSWW